MKVRKTGIDLVKIIAIVFVPCLHYFSNYGFLEQAYIGIDKIVLVSIRMISMSCIGLFIMSTGYLQCEKEFSKEYVKKLKPYLIMYLIYCCLTAMYLDVVHVDKFKKQFLYIFFRFAGYYWYMAFFVGFYLFIPFFNNIFRNIDKKQFEVWLCVLFFVIALPEFMNEMPALSKQNGKVLYLPNWWREGFPLLYYSLGAFFRKYTIKIKKLFWILVMVIAQGGVSIIDYYYSEGGKPIFFGGGYGSLLVLLSVFTIFGTFYDIEIHNHIVQNIVEYIGKITLNIYFGLVISDNLTQKIVGEKISWWFQNGSDKLYPVVVMINFGIALLLAIIVQGVIDIAKQVKYSFETKKKGLSRL